MKVFYLILDILQRSKDVYFLILQVIIDPMVHYLNIQDIMNWNAVDALLLQLSARIQPFTKQKAAHSEQQYRLLFKEFSMCFHDRF